MNRPKKLFATLFLICALGLTVFAGGTNAPPCPPPDPGQVEMPPCTTAPGDNSPDLVPGTSGDSVSEIGVNGQYSSAEVAIGTMEMLLPLF